METDFRPDPERQSRIGELATKSTEGQLSEEERAEYEGYVRANKFIAMLQRQARRRLGANSRSLGSPVTLPPRPFVYFGEARPKPLVV